MKQFPIGCALLFLLRKEGCLIAEKHEVILKVGNLSSLRSKVKEVERKVVRENQGAKLLGIEDLFEVEQPTARAGVIGKTNLWSVTSLSRAKKEPNTHIGKVAIKKPCVLTAVYFIKTLNSKKDRALLVDVVIDTRVKGKSDALLRSTSFIKRLERMVAKEHKVGGVEFLFLGLANKYQLKSRIKFGQPHLVFNKQYKDKARVARLLLKPAVVKSKFRLIAKANVKS